MVAESEGKEEDGKREEEEEEKEEDEEEEEVMRCSRLNIVNTAPPQFKDKYSHRLKQLQISSSLPSLTASLLFCLLFSSLLSYHSLSSTIFPTLCSPIFLPYFLLLLSFS